VYGYPHKTAYRPLAPKPLSEVWRGEDKRALYLYLHVPFCEMRCGFCNLFTTVRPEPALVEGYVASVRRQARQVRAALGEGALGFARFAIGGGTPSYLSVGQLDALFEVAHEVLGADVRGIPTSVEVSPETATPDKLAALRAWGVDRVSMGVQSFVEEETDAIHRRQTRAQAEASAARLVEAGFPTVNLDLMYGLPTQTTARWLDSLRAALRFGPQELYLYPLYVRPLTRMGMSDREWDDQRLEHYREGRALLLSEGYGQVSMRMFRKGALPPAPVYRCQEDGMVGLGCGARSYTRALHHSSAYAVGPMQVKAIIQAYNDTSDAAFGVADYGFELGAQEQRRRYAILSLLSDEGLELARFQGRFGQDALAWEPRLQRLVELGMARLDGGVLRLTEAGLERSDAVGPWLYSEQVQRRMDEYAAR
jgi:oxygen-independent coproporphyrinogen-3 oxidase